MAKKLSEYEDKERTSIENSIMYTNKKSIDYNEEKISYMLGRFGLCKDCAFFQYAATEFDIARAYCFEFDSYLRANNPIKYCNRYSKKGQLPLYELKEMAYILETDDKKIGF